MTVEIRNLEHELRPNPGVSDHVLAVSDSVVEMPALDADTDMALVTFEDADVRATFDGSDPASDNGHLIQEYRNLHWNASVSQAAKLIRAGGTDATLRISELVYGRTNARRTGIRAANFNDIFEDLMVAVGTDPDLTDGLSSYEEAALCRHLERVLATVWHWCFWPVLTVCEERTVLEADDGTRYVPRTAAGHYNLGDVLRNSERRGVSARNPRTSDYPGWLNWQTGPEGVIVDDLAGDEVWIEYRIECPELTRTAYAADTAYSAGDVVYWADTGECYQCVEATTGHNPADSTYWTQIEIPWIFSHVLAEAAAARWMRANAKKGWGSEQMEDAWDLLYDLRDTHGPREIVKAVVE